MHKSAMISLKIFLKLYCKTNTIVLDFGGKDVNGSLRELFKEFNIKYMSCDIEKDETVDLLYKHNLKLDLEDNSIDNIITISTFEHDPCFWITFKEMIRVLKKDGHIFVNAPSNGPYHKFPGDNWRFKYNAAHSLVYWSNIDYNDYKTEPVEIVECFTLKGNQNQHLKDYDYLFLDYICIFKKTLKISKEYILNDFDSHKLGPLEKQLNNLNIFTTIN